MYPVRRGAGSPIFVLPRTAANNKDVIDALMRENASLRERVETVDALVCENASLRECVRLLERQLKQGEAKTWPDDERLKYYDTIWKPTDNDRRLVAEARQRKMTPPVVEATYGLSYRDALNTGGHVH